MSIVILISSKCDNEPSFEKIFIIIIKASF